jgi:hypothetical protein
LLRRVPLHLLQNVAGAVDDLGPLLVPALCQRFSGRAGVGENDVVVSPIVGQSPPLHRGFLPGHHNCKADDRQDGHGENGKAGNRTILGFHGFLLPRGLRDTAEFTFGSGVSKYRGHAANRKFPF